ncbi:catechol 2,3-dioxygenase-like lactoylglutathione lyase family enzyme [Nakamurella sp. UYEF19]|uniref:VOC family protein n=1 Tax=Nakamurella sp. UYEF19 TaxID=1756392 RepID=UPI00339A911C
MPVADQDRAKEFYVGVLGFDLIRENPMGGDLQPWGRFVTFADPDGNGIVLQSTAPDA